MTGARNLDDLIEGLDVGRYHTNPDWARVVFSVANGGDEVARELVAWAGHELGQLACAVIRQLGFQNEAIEVIQIGGLFNGGSLYTDAFHEVVWSVAPCARFVRLCVPPVVGGVLVAAEAAGLDPRSIREALISSTQSMVREREKR